MHCPGPAEKTKNTDFGRQYQRCGYRYRRQNPGGLPPGFKGHHKIIIAQRISSVSDADKIIVLDDGNISAIGTHEELLQSSHIYREVYQSQQKGAEE